MCVCVCVCVCVYMDFKAMHFPLSTVLAASSILIFFVCVFIIQFNDFFVLFFGCRGSLLLSVGFL